MSGRLLAPPLLREMKKTVAEDPTDPNTTFRYGLGLERVNDACGANWGHGGAIYGYQDMAYWNARHGPDRRHRQHHVPRTRRRRSPARHSDRSRPVRQHSHLVNRPAESTAPQPKARYGAAASGPLDAGAVPGLVPRRAPSPALSLLRTGTNPLASIRRDLGGGAPTGSPGPVPHWAGQRGASGSHRSRAQESGYARHGKPQNACYPARHHPQPPSQQRYLVDVLLSTP